MIVSFDIHGVIDTYTPEFIQIMKDSRAIGLTVFVLTGPPAEEAKQELATMGIHQHIHYSKLISVVDWLKEHLDEDEMWLDEKGTWWCNDADWWCSKARICKEYNIAAHYDDSEKYLIGWDATDCKTKFYLVKDGDAVRKR